MIRSALAALSATLVLSTRAFAEPPPVVEWPVTPVPEPLPELPRAEPPPAAVPTTPPPAEPPATPSPPSPPDAIPASAPKPIAPNSKAPGVAGLRVDGGYTRRWVVGLPVTGGEVGLGLGAEPTKHAAVWFDGRLLLGQTVDGLDVYTARIGIDAELILDRLRLSVGPGVFFIGISRVERFGHGGEITSWGPGIAAAARLDVFRSKGFAIYPRIAFDASYEGASGTVYFGPTFGVGIDLDSVSDRAERRDPTPSR